MEVHTWAHTVISTNIHGVCTVPHTPPSNSSFLTMSVGHWGPHVPLSPSPINMFQCKISTILSKVDSCSWVLVGNKREARQTFNPEGTFYIPVHCSNSFRWNKRRQLSPEWYHGNMGQSMVPMQIVNCHFVMVPCTKQHGYVLRAY